MPVFQQPPNQPIQKLQYNNSEFLRQVATYIYYSNNGTHTHPSAPNNVHSLTTEKKQQQQQRQSTTVAPNKQLK